MSIEKDYKPDSHAEPRVVAAKASEYDDQVYDPSMESKWTRLGLNFESYKRAPGHTAQQVVHGDNGKWLSRLAFLPPCPGVGVGVALLHYSAFA